MSIEKLEEERKLSDDDIIAIDNIIMGIDSIYTENEIIKINKNAIRFIRVVKYPKFNEYMVSIYFDSCIINVYFDIEKRTAKRTRIEFL
jgi:hypothetical protein